ncbi:MAG: ribbon-helix-helix protein, CopG family [Saccharopolyspora sp.]|uniref:CopG family antitoxin n=1 Tax=Saccharopolyspora TaxID=1835 RepID=UPI001909D805|nr:MULTISPECIES: CopG family antitoxin [unclassified Saccharopolyspora]MBK0866286.1 ribbon-helix-helix protein, CopG family [Saccharopolyspora sp. HNM0986]MBQ6639531.1 ribbon-helix-helix protein, CopG family [Saccharopolyspora sp.]
MTATKKKDQGQARSTEELDELAAYYDAHDTSEEMEQGQWVEPQPMKTTSLRLPADVVEALKKLAQARGVRYTALLREIVEQAVYETHSVHSDELAEINQRLARIEAELDSKPATTER